MKLNKNIMFFLVNSLLLNNLNISMASSVSKYDTNLNIEQEIRNLNNTWINLPDTPKDRTKDVVLSINDKIYQIGGWNGSSYFKSIDVYDTISDSWVENIEMPLARRDFTASSHNNKIYIIGGVDENRQLISDIDIYDIESKSWSKGSNITTPRMNLASEVIDDKIYCIGGHTNLASDNSRYTVNTVEIYDIKTDSWVTGEPLLRARTNHQSIKINDKIYIIGGTFSPQNINDIEVFDKNIGIWENLLSFSSQMPNISEYSVSSYKDKIYFIGGTNTYTGEFINTIKSYDTKNKNWTVENSMPTARTGTKSINVNNRIYCLNGMDDSYITVKNVEVLITDATQEDLAKIKLSNISEKPNVEEISEIREIVNTLKESNIKKYLNSTLDNMPVNLEISNKKNVTSNVDIYIKSENMLLMNLSTNSITFDNYSGVDEIEKTNALNISINSSLPYTLNAYLVDEMYNSDRTKKIDIDRLQIKDNEDTSYKEFTNINEKLVLKDNCDSGNDKSHSIDLKLKGGNAYESDIYKTVIKFEAEQI